MLLYSIYNKNIIISTSIKLVDFRKQRNNIFNYSKEDDGYDLQKRILNLKI